MTLQTSAPHKKPRWLALVVAVTTLVVVGTSLASAHAGGSTPIPARYAGGTQVDIDPPPGPSVNDVPGQVDMTQMGRDTSANPNIRDLLELGLDQRLGGQRPDGRRVRALR